MNRFTLCIMLLYAYSLSADVLDVGFKVFDKPMAYGKDSNIGLEIRNKDKKHAIWVAFKNGSDIFSRLGKTAFQIDSLKTLQSASGYQFEIDINKPTELAVWYSDPGKVEVKKTGLLGLVGPEAFSPTPKKVFSLEPGKTLYLNWTENETFVPQRGPLGGRLKKTDSNLSLENNIQESQIHPIQITKG